MKRILLFTTISLIVLISGFTSVKAYSGNTFETRYERTVYNYASSYGYDYISSDYDEDWFGIRQSVIDFIFFDVPVSGNLLETKYEDSAYDIYSTGITDTKGQLYNVDKKLVVPFPDFWNSYYKDVLGSRISYNYDSGVDKNFKITAKIDLSDEYAIKVTRDDVGDRGSYKLYTAPHQDTSVFYYSTKSWVPLSSYSPNSDSQYNIERIIYHNQQTASFEAELLRMAHEDQTIFTVLFQTGLSGLIGAAAGAVACSYVPGASVACGLAAGTISSMVTGVYLFTLYDKAEQEYLSICDTCDAIFKLKYISGGLRQVPECQSGSKQIITTRSFLSLNITSNKFYSFSAEYREELLGPKYLDGYFTYN